MNQVGNQSTLLIPAVKENNKKYVQTLLKNNVDVNTTDGHGKTALHYAIENNNSEIVMALLDAKADMYFKESTDKISADHAIEASDENQTIVKLIITEKILEDSIAILKDWKKCDEVSETEEKSKTKEVESEIEEVYQTEESSEKYKKAENEIKFTEAEIAENDAYKKIKALSKRLEDPKPSEYKAANTFLLFLEIFCCDNSSEISNEIKYMSDTLLKKRSLTPEIIINIIEHCSSEFNSDHTYHELVGKKIQFFIELAEFLKSLESSENLFGISNFFNCDNVQQINYIIYSDELDPEEIDDEFKDKLKSLFVQAHCYTGQSHVETDISWEQQWFEFNVNIYPYFIREVNKENKGLMEHEMSQLRDNFVHSFEPVLKKNWVQSFTEFIIKLEGKLLEYFYAKKLHKRFCLTSSNADYNQIKENINKDFESIRDEFKPIRLNTNCFASKFENSLFPMLSSGDVDRWLVKDCFYFISIIEYLNENLRNKISYYSSNVDDTEKILGFKLLDDRSRRRFFEQYINLKRYKKEEDKVNYILEKESLISGLSEYSTDKECIENLFKHYLDKDKSLDVRSLANDVFKFIELLFTLNKWCIKANEIDFMRFVECIFRNATDLDISQVSKAFPDIIPKIRADFITIFTNININGIEVDVKATIILMFKTFFNAFNEYKIVSNVNDLFKRETFLDALLHEQDGLLRSEKKKLISVLIQIDYMTPFLVKFIVRFQNDNHDLINECKSEGLIKKLIQYLTKEGCLNYLSNLLAVKFDKFDPYDLLLDFIEEKIYLECIHQIFDSFDHIQGFANALLLKYITFGNNNNNDQSYNHFIERIVTPFLKLTNLKVNDQFSRIRIYYKNKNDLNEFKLKECKRARDMLEISKQIGEQYSLTACHVHCIDRDFLNAVICNEEGKSVESLNFFNVVKSKLHECTISKHSEIHGKYELLRLLIKFYIIKTNVMYDSMEIKQEGDLNERTVIVTSFKKLYDEIVNKFCNKRAGFENILHTYKELIDDENYKNLLTTSELLCSKKYFNINNITLSIVFFIWRKYRAGPRTSSDVSELQNALDILENYVYICRKSSETTDFLKHVATIYMKVSLQRLSSSYETELVYCLKGLTRLIMYYNIRKDTPAIFSRNYIEKIILNLLHEYIFKQFQYTKGMDLNISRLDKLTQVYNICKQVLTSINDWPTTKKLDKHYLQMLEVTADVCQDCGYYYKQKGRPEWTKFYRETVEHSKSTIKLHELVGNSNEKCCENSIKLIEYMEMTLDYFDKAESYFRDIHTAQNNNPLLCCRSENIKL